MRSQRKRPNTDKIGQMLIVGFDGSEITPPIASLLTRLQPAGVILFARNIKSADQTWRLLRECQKCVDTPLFTCVDLEGGAVDRFRDALGAAPSAAEVFSYRRSRSCFASTDRSSARTAVRWDSTSISRLCWIWRLRRPAM